MNEHLIAKMSKVAVLGSLGNGAAGSAGANFLAETNASPIAAGSSPAWTSAAFVSVTGRVRISARMTLSKNGGSFANGDNATFNLIRDIGTGAVLALAPQSRDVGKTDGSDVVANSVLDWVDTVTPGDSHTYSIRASAISSGHTAGVLTGEATIVVEDI